ncbi:glycosyltransferase family 2 protein [Brachybacterium sp. Z12]|nr:glycosyltransferase family 2 protein [Brachybacterium sp. Z12]
MALYVSVIIPVYNSEHYVRDAIRSVQEQSLDPDLLEILVVDDGSTDGSGALLHEIAASDPRVTVISQENSGTPGGGRNPAIGRARVVSSSSSSIPMTSSPPMRCRRWCRLRTRAKQMSFSASSRAWTRVTHPPACSSTAWRTPTSSRTTSSTPWARPS